jgi:hypothetical protein
MEGKITIEIATRGRNTITPKNNVWVLKLRFKIRKRNFKRTLQRTEDLTNSM